MEKEISRASLSLDRRGRALLALLGRLFRGYWGFSPPEPKNEDAQLLSSLSPYLGREQ